MFFSDSVMILMVCSGEWWSSIIDVIEILIGGNRPPKYWNDIKNKLAAEGYSEVSEKSGLGLTILRYSPGSGSF